MNGKPLEEVGHFKYLGCTQTKDGISIKEVLIRLVQAHSAMTILALLSKNKAISFQRWNTSNHLASCDSWMLTTNLERRIQAFESKCYRTMLGVSYREHKETNKYDSKSVFSPDVRSFYCQPSSVTSYHGSAMSFTHFLCHDYHPLLLVLLL